MCVSSFLILIPTMAVVPKRTILVPMMLSLSLSSSVTAFGRSFARSSHLKRPRSCSLALFSTLHQDESTLAPAEAYDARIINHELVGERHLAQDPSKPFFPIYYNDVYEVKLPPNHRFPMEKYRQVRNLAQTWISSQTQQEQAKVVCDFRVSPLATVEEVTTTHSPDYVDRYLRGDLTEAELRNVGFPWSVDGIKRSFSSVGGTVAAAVAVCESLQQFPDSTVWSGHVAGGTHHAFYDYGEGFCVFSDIAVAANVVLQRFRNVVKRILILDLDVHQGNGNAVLFQRRSDVMTFSMHCDANYFSPKEESDLDVELPVDCKDETYLATLRHWLKQINEKGGEFDLVFFQAGVDVLEQDRLGRMSLTSEGVIRRNELVFDFARERKVPLVITMGGGYPARDDWTPILEAHANVYLQAQQYLATNYESQRLD